MKKLLVSLLAVMCLLTVVGCGKKNALSEETKDAVDNLYSIQSNYSQGVAPLIEIPPMWAQELYDNFDAIIESGDANAPISLREYAVTNVVYFDYDDDYSVVWDKNNDSVSIEPTDVEEREAFKEKMHK